MTVKIFRKDVYKCTECPNLLIDDYIPDETEYWCQNNGWQRQIDDPNVLPKWCPLPGLERGE